MGTYFCIFLATAGVQLIYGQHLHTGLGKLSELDANLQNDGEMDAIISFSDDVQRVDTSTTSEQSDSLTLEINNNLSRKKNNGIWKDHATNSQTTEQKRETISKEIASSDDIEAVDRSIGPLEQRAGIKDLIMLAIQIYARLFCVALVIRGFYGVAYALFKVFLDKIQQTIGDLYTVTKYNSYYKLLQAVEQVQTVPRKLSDLASRLHHDTDIRNDINRLARDVQRVATSFPRILEAGGDLTGVDVHTLRRISQAMSDSLTSEEQMTLKNSIHRSKEKCDERRKDCATNIQTKKQKIDTITKKVASLDANIEAIGNLERRARYFDNQAENQRRQARQRRDDDIYYKSLYLGLVYAVFTGACLAIAGTRNLVDVNLDDVAEDYDRTAKRLKLKAESKRPLVPYIRNRQEDLEVEKRTLEHQIKVLQTCSDELKQTADGLYDVSRFLRSSLDDINNFLRLKRMK